MTEQKPTAEAVRVAQRLVQPLMLDFSLISNNRDLKWLDESLVGTIATLITAKDETIKTCNDALQDYEKQVLKLEGYLERANWRRCDIPACNCNGYHNWNPRRDEIEEPLREQITSKNAEIQLERERTSRVWEIHANTEAKWVVRESKLRAECEAKDAEIDRLKREQVGKELLKEAKK